MRPYQKWLSVGLLALTPNIALADAFSQTSPSAENAPARRKGVPNQELAERVAKALRQAKLSHYEIDIDVRSGVVTLVGKIAKPEQRIAAEKAVRSVPGVTQIVDRLEVVESRPNAAVRQAVASRPSAGSSQYVRQVDGRDMSAGLAPDQLAGAPAQFASAAPAQLVATPMAAPVGYPGSAGGHAMYNQPNFPNNAWPTYAQYPNYAAVTYPSQYSASAWPYIGPFYPYPQVPLGWRKATLEWDDGYWNLNFRDRTERWWWFLNPQNW
jgi:hypothetical protein